MKISSNNRGFRYILHPEYVDKTVESAIFQESSAIGDYEDSYEIPGSSYLLFDAHHLNREEVGQVIELLQYWLENKRLPPK